METKSLFHIITYLLWLSHDDLWEQTTQGSFVPNGREDILNIALGRLKHLGRVRVAGHGVTISSTLDRHRVPPTLLRPQSPQINW